MTCKDLTVLALGVVVGTTWQPSRAFLPENAPTQEQRTTIGPDACGSWEWVACDDDGVTCYGCPPQEWHHIGDGADTMEYRMLDGGHVFTDVINLDAKPSSGTITGSLACTGCLPDDWIWGGDITHEDTTPPGLVLPSGLDDVYDDNQIGAATIILDSGWLSGMDDLAGTSAATVNIGWPGVSIDGDEVHP